MSRFCHFGLPAGCLALIFYLLVPAPGGSAATIIDIQRGVHPGFELLVVYCDTIPEFSLYYDRVRGECRLDLAGGEYSDSVVREAASFRPGVTLQSVKADSFSGTITLTVMGTVYLREYLVNGPPALLLDISRAEETSGRLPFELDSDDYLQRGGKAEREGRLELAARYIERVQQCGVNEPFLEHRAGVIYHRLGRWEAALELFARTAELPEFAADANARRSMIFLTLGDTSAAGRAWTDYFHRIEPGEIYSEVGPLPSRAVGLPRRSGRSGGRPSVSFPPVIKAGDDTNMYLGWGLLFVGLLALIGLLIDPWRRAALAAGAYRGERSWSDEELRPHFAPEPRSRFRVDRPAVYETRSPTAGVGPPHISPRMAELYRSGKPGGLRPTPASTRQGAGERRIPTDVIIQKAQAGTGELEIARQLGLGRDEVSMVLNLARLAGRGAGGRKN